MARREIIILPDKRLRLVSEPVKKITADIRRLVDDMLETMYDAPGIGLAAVQVGVARRVVIVMDLAPKDEPRQPRFFVNPEILWASAGERNLTRKAAFPCRRFFERVERPARVQSCALPELSRVSRSEEDAGKGYNCRLHPARDRPSRRRAVHRPSFTGLKRDRVIKKFSKAAKRAVEGTSGEHARVSVAYMISLISISMARCHV